MPVVKADPDDEHFAHKPEVLEESQGPLFADAPDPNEVQPLRGVSGAKWLNEPPPRRKKRKRSWPLSPTKLRVVQQCPKRAYERWVNRRFTPGGPEATIGLLIHGAYQDAGERRINAPKTKQPPRMASVPELLHLLEHQPAQLALEKREHPPITEVMWEEAREIIVNGGALDFGNTIAAELPVTLPLRVGMPKTGGIIDRVDRHWNSDGSFDIEVIDYKTDHEERDVNELIDDPQPSIYLIWARAHYYQARQVRFRVFNPRQNWWSDPLIWSPHLQELMTSQLIAAANVIQTESTQARPGPHCAHCPYKDKDGSHDRCESYHKLLAEASKHLVAGHQDGTRLAMGELVAHYDLVHTNYKLFEERRKELRKEILSRMKHKKKYEDDFFSLTISKRSQDTYTHPSQLMHDLATVSRVKLADLIDLLLKVNDKQVDQWVKRLPMEQQLQAQHLLRHYKTSGFETTQIRVRELPQDW